MNRSIREEASEWFVEFRTGEPTQRARKAFHAWLKESPAHMAAYLEMAALWNESGSLEVRSKWPLESLIGQARADGGNVVTLDPGEITASSRQVQSRAYWSRSVLVAAAAAVLLGAVFGIRLWMDRDLYNTGIGEQRSVILSDGSTVAMNARTRLRIRYDERERHIDLLEGQALFTVAKNKERPFVVESKGAQVRAVGTEFDVYEKASRTTVTVVEGTVAITPGASPPRSGPSLLSAGEQVTVDAVTPVTRTKVVNVAAVTAWTQRRLIFDNTPLQQVAEEFNRYNHRQFVIRDPKLREFTIDGVFSSTDHASLVSFLRSRPGVTVTETQAEIIVDAR